MSGVSGGDDGGPRGRCDENRPRVRSSSSDGGATASSSAAAAAATTTTVAAATTTTRATVGGIGVHAVHGTITTGHGGVADAIRGLRRRLHDARRRVEAARSQASAASTSSAAADGGGGEEPSRGGSWARRLRDRLHGVDAVSRSGGGRRETVAASLPNPTRGGGGVDDGDGEVKEEEREGVVAMSYRSYHSSVTTTSRHNDGSSQMLHVSATIFSIDAREAARDYDDDDPPLSSAASGRRGSGMLGGNEVADPAEGSSQVRRRSSVLFASRVIATRSLLEGTSRVLLASGGGGDDGGSEEEEASGGASGRAASARGVARPPSRRDLLGLSGRLHSAGDVGSLRDFEMHVHPSISRRMLDSVTERSDEGSCGGGGSFAETGGGEKMDVDADDRDSDEDVMDVTPAVEAKAADANGELYSWGRGEQTLHDDDADRVIEFGHDEDDDGDRRNKLRQRQENIMVSSRLGSKSILHASCSMFHSAASTSQGTLYVAGRNVNGCVDPNLPEGEVISRPMLLDGISNVRVLQVSCGYDHTAVLSSNGSVLTWGSNAHGQLGHRMGSGDNQKVRSADFRGPTRCRPTGLALGKGRKASSVACGTNYTMVLTRHMSLLVCGIPAMAGDRDADRWGTAREVPSLMGLPLVGMSAGDGHAAVVTAHGTAFVWGENRSGCCARDFPRAMTLPVPVRTSSAGEGRQSIVTDDIAIQNVACGMEHSIFVTRKGDLLVCGSNYRGQLGISASEAQSTSKLLTVNHPMGGKFVSAEAGNGHSLLLDSAGNVWTTDVNGLSCIIEGKRVLAISSGGDGNCIAVASAPSGPKTLQRQFSMDMPEDSKSIVDTVDELLSNMETDGHENAHVGEEIAKNTENLLCHPPVLNLILNPQKLETIFERILCTGNVATRQAIAKSIERGLLLGLRSLRDSRLMYPEAVRCLLSYIKFFSIRQDEDIVFDVRGEAISLFCDTILGIPFEGYRALHDFATNLYPKELFVKMLVRPLLVMLNSCTESTTDENEVQHFSPSRRAVPVIVAVLSWLHAISQEVGLADPANFYSDGVSSINIESLFEDLYKMKRASPKERSQNFFLCAHPFLLSPGCKRNLLQMESQVEMFKAMMGDVAFTDITNEVKVNPFYNIEIEREHLMEQTLERIKQSQPKNLRKRLRVTFKGEEGLDAGGVTKEFFQLLSEELFDVHSNLWSNKYGDEVNWFNSENTWDDQAYELVGVLFGLAMYNSVLLDVRFPLAVYRKILGLPLGLEDLMDEELRKGLKQLLDYEGDDVEDIFCLTFELNWMEMGEEKKLELKPGGANIPVTKENREEYVLRYVRWVLVDSIYPQWDSFQTGVMRVLEDSSLDLFLPEELELLVVGTPDLDFEALEANTKYEGGYNEDSAVVKNFWKYVKAASHETQVRLLKFCAATTKAPIGGLGKMDFLIQRAGPDSSNLPTSHTCFNTLILPDYGTYEKLETLLGRAILECEGFGLE